MAVTEENVVLGVEVLVKVNTGTEADPTWTVVGGQRDLSINYKTDKVNVGSKDFYGWTAEMPNTIGYTIDFGGLYVPSDACWQRIKQAWKRRELIMIEVLNADGTREQGKCVIEYSVDYPWDDAATAKGTLSGFGELEDLPAA